MAQSPDTRPAPRAKPMLSARAITIILSVPLLVGLSLIGIPPFDELRSGFTELTYCVAHDCNPSGPAASWQEQYAAASEAATKIESSAFLVSVTALPAAHNYDDWSPEKALKVIFTFSTPAGQDIEVSLLDTSPSTTLDAWKSGLCCFRRFSEDSYYTPDTLAETLRNITITPRQVVSITWPLASVQANQRLQKVHPSISFEPLTYESVWSKPDVWTVSYWSSFKKDLPFDSAYSSGYAVDKSTGEVLSHKYKLFDPLLPKPTK